MQRFFSLLSWRLFVAQHVSGVFPPIIRSSMTAVVASGFTFVSWWQSCCVRGRAGRAEGGDNPYSLLLYYEVLADPREEVSRSTGWASLDLKLRVYFVEPGGGEKWWGVDGGMEEGAELGMGVGRITHETIKTSIHPSTSLCIWGLSMLVYNVYNIQWQKKEITYAQKLFRREVLF